MNRATLIEESTFSDVTKIALCQTSPANRKLRFVTIGDLVDYCTKDGRSVRSLLNLKELSPMMVTDIRTVLTDAKLLTPAKL